MFEDECEICGDGLDDEEEQDNGLCHDCIWDNENDCFS